MGRPLSDHPARIRGRTRTLVHQTGALHAGGNAGMQSRAPTAAGLCWSSQRNPVAPKRRIQPARVFDPPGAEIDSGDFSDARSGRIILARAARTDDFDDAGPEKPGRRVAVGPDTANRSSIKKKRYPGGFLNLVGANSMAGLSSRPVPVVIMDEVDAALRATRGASNPTRLASARTTAFFDRKEIFLSSPSNDSDETGILQMWEDSSRGRLETQCPNPLCAHWQVLQWERMDFDAVKLSCVRMRRGIQPMGMEWTRRGV